MPYISKELPSNELLFPTGECNERSLLIFCALYGIDPPEKIKEERVSVIVPAYNDEKYIAQCMDSILSSYFPLRRMEIIVVDDASTDSTRQILREYEARYPENILLMENDTNAGPGVVRNTALSVATGDYVCFVDGDDIITEDAISLLYLGAAAFSADFSEGELDVFSDSIPSPLPGGEWRLYEPDLQEKKRLLYVNAPDAGVCRRLYRTKLLRENRIFLHEGRRMEDLMFSLEATAYAKKIWRAGRVVYHYRENKDSITRSKGQKKHYMDYFDSMVACILDFKKRDLYLTYARELSYIYFRKASLDIYLLIRDSMDEAERENMKKIVEYADQNLLPLDNNEYMTENDFSMRAEIYSVLGAE